MRQPGFEPESQGWEPSILPIEILPLWEIHSRMLQINYQIFDFFKIQTSVSNLDKIIPSERGFKLQL